jgi:hypothetical protein
VSEVDDVQRRDIGETLIARDEERVRPVLLKARARRALVENGAGD